MIGRTGVVSVATRGCDGAGEVMVAVRGSSEAYLAWSDRLIAKGSAVLEGLGPR